MPPTEVPDSNINFPQSEEEILKVLCPPSTQH
jgi:hypothetical protein